MNSETLVLAVDSTQANSAAAALDKMAAAGGKAETSASLLAKASTAQGKALASIAPAASKTASVFGELATAQQKIGATGAKNLAAGSAELGKTAASANGAIAAVKQLAREAELAGDKIKAAFKSARPAPADTARSPVAPSIAAAVSGAAGAGRTAAAEFASVGQASQSASKSIDAYIQKLQVSAATNGLSAREAKLYELSLRGASRAQLDAASSALKLNESYERGVQIGERFRKSLLTIAAVGAVAFVGAVVGINKLFESAAKFQDLAESTGASAEGLASLAVASATAGLSVEQVATATLRLTKSLTGVDDESKAAGAALAALGIPIKEFKSLDPVAQIDALTKAFGQFADGSGKSAVALALFGRGGAEQLRLFKALEEQGGRQTILTQRQIELADEHTDKQAASVAQIKLYAAALATEALPAVTALSAVLADLARETATTDAATAKLGASNAVRDFARSAALGVASLVDEFRRASVEISAFIAATQAEVATVKVVFSFLNNLSNGGTGEFFKKGTGPLKEALDARNAAIAKADATALAAANKGGKSIADALRKKFAEQDTGAANGTAAGKGLAAKPTLNFDGAEKKPKRGRSDHEPEQVRQAVFTGDIKFLHDRLAEERDTIEFHNRELSALYLQGNTSLVDYYAQRNKSIAEGVQKERDTLGDEQVRIEVELQNPLVKANPSEQVKLTTQLRESLEKTAKVELQANRETRLSELQKVDAFRQLNDQVDSYRANLRQLQGDEVGAAKIRATLAAQQLSVLARQSKDTKNEITPQQEAASATGEQQVIAINEAKRQTSFINQRLQIEEERIAVAQRNGALSETAALQKTGEARKNAVAQMEQELVELERLAKERPLDIQLNIDASRARLELEKLSAELDPLADKFRNLFANVGASALEGLLNGGSAKNAAKQFIGDLTRQINAETSKQISGAIFGKGGVLGGVFASKDKQDGSHGSELDVGKILGATNSPVSAETSAVSASLTALKTAGVDPATASLSAFVTALDRAALAASGGTAPQSAGLADVQPGASATGEKSIVDLFKEPTTEAATFGGSLVATTSAAQEFAGVIGPASAVLGSLGKAGGVAAQALSLLPSILGVIGTSSATSAAGSAIGSAAGAAGGSGGGFFSTIASFFGSFFHSGGVVGQTSDMRPVNPSVFAGAAKYHQGGIIDGGSLPGLKADEVPAILLRNEEVLTADDPRHRANIAPQLLKTIENGSTVLDTLAAGKHQAPRPGLAGLVAPAAHQGALASLIKHDQQARELSPLTRYLIGSPATVQGLIGELTKEAQFENIAPLREIQVAGRRELGGPVSARSTYRVNESGPEVFNVAGKSYLMTGNQAGSVTAAHDVRTAAAPQVNVTLNQSFAPGTNRQTIDQAAVRASQAINRSIARGTA